MTDTKEIRQFHADIAQLPTIVEKEEASKNFLAKLIAKRTKERKMRTKMHNAAEEFDAAGQPMGGAKND